MKDEYQINEHNNNIINSFGKTAMNYFRDISEYCDVTEKIIFVDKPNGDKQNKNYRMFKNIHVEQWSGWGFI